MATEYHHGITIQQVESAPPPSLATSPSVIGLVGWGYNNPSGSPAGTPVQVNTLAAGLAAFGAEGTIYPALRAIFDQSRALVVVVNALGADDKSTVSARESVTLTDGEGALSHAHVVPGTVKLYAASSGGSALAIQESGATVSGAVYEVDPETGAIERLSGTATTVYATYDYFDATQITDAEVGVAAAQLETAEATLGRKPQLIIAPGWASKTTGTGVAATAAPIATLLAPVARRLRAVLIVDVPLGGAANAAAYQAAAVKFRSFFDSDRTLLVGPRVKAPTGAGGAIALEWASPRVAGLFAANDRARGWWTSPSNQRIIGITGTEIPISFAIDDPTAAAASLNAQAVATVVPYQGGFRLWGSRAPTSDAKYRFLPIARTRDTITEALLRSHAWAVDRNVTATYLDEVAESVNAFLRGLIGQGAIESGECKPDEGLNTATARAAGQVFFNISFRPYWPAEQVVMKIAVRTPNEEG